MADPISSALGVGGIASNILGNVLNSGLNSDKLAFAKHQYEDMKRYNSADEQVKRLRAAGMNPALTFGQNAGMSQSVSQPESIPFQPMDLGGLSSLAQGISLNKEQVKNLQANTDKTNTESDLNRVDLRTRFIEKLVDIDNKLADTHLKSSQRDYLVEQKDYLRKQIKFADERFEWENHNLRLEAYNKSLQNEALVIQNKYLPMFNEQQIKNLISTMALNYAAAGEHKANSKKIVQETISECIRSGILGEDFYKNMPDAIKGKNYSDALKNSPMFRRLETTLDKVVYPMLDHGPTFFVPIK